uniref:Ribonuclease H-like domain-containing protein n=1 Tax=Tanacetum cinerariifolium TaxID=118510 RepID=A0A6L2JWG0_TANCI|nr:ribonuclease H-like domain-containing protein [Tanacetum cinerariifolium]
MAKLPKCSCVAWKDVSKHNKLIKLMQFLMGLNDVFLPIRSSLLARETLPDVKEVFVIISREESHRGVASSSSGSVTKAQISSFVAKSNSWTNNGNKKFDNNKRIGNSSNNRGLNPNLHCTNCGNFGHIVDRCFDIIGHPPGYNKNHGPNLNGPRTFDANSVSSSSEKGREFFNNNVFFNLNFKIFYNSKYVMCKVTLGWIIDSEANQHMTISTLNTFGIIDITDLNLTRDLNFTKDSHVSPCDIYHKAKQTREPFPFSDHQTTDISELIHLDLLPSSILNVKSPFKHVYGFKPKLSHLRSFGCLCFSFVLNNSDKFSVRSEKCVLIGFSTTKKAYKVYSLESKMIYYSRDIKFYENIFPFKMNDSFQKEQSILSESSDNNVNGLNFFDEKHSNFKTSISPNDDERVYDTPHNDGNVHPYSSNVDECEDDFATSMGETSSSEGNVHINSDSHAQGNFPESTSQDQPDLRRSSRVPKMFAKFNDYVVNNSKKYGLEKYVTYTNLNTSNYRFFTNLNKSIEPTSYFGVVKNPNWIEAMNNEIKALNRNNTWTICDLPMGKKAVGSKWLWKIKYKYTGEIERYKARVVAKGFSQREGFDYLETFSLVLDINNVVLYGDLSEDVYMTLPPGFDNKSKVCKLNKSLYGLKQAPKQWNAKLTQASTEHGFVQSKFDYSLFTKNSDYVFIILLVYVDDIVVTGNNVNEIEKFKQFLKSKFQIKDLGKLKYFMGIKVLDNKDGICLSQRNYCLELLHEFGLLVAEHVNTPLPENATLNQGSPGSGIQINKTDNLKLRAYADSDWASKKQSTLAMSSAEAEYRSMAFATCKVIWLSNLLGDMGVKNLLPIVMYYDNSSALQIAANPVFMKSLNILKWMFI